MDQELYEDIFNKLYEEAVPGSEHFDEEDYGDTPTNFVHYLDGDRQLEIIDEICEEYGVPYRERK